MLIKGSEEREPKSSLDCMGKERKGNGEREKGKRVLPPKSCCAPLRFASLCKKDSAGCKPFVAPGLTRRLFDAAVAVARRDSSLCQRHAWYGTIDDQSPSHLLSTPPPPPHSRNTAGDIRDPTADPDDAAETHTHD
jgi:hypothetical protein